MTPIGPFLTEFQPLALPRPPATWPPVYPEPPLTPIEDEDEPEPPADDPHAMAIEEARRAGAREIAAETERLVAALRADLAAEHEAQRAADRQAWVETESLALSRLLEERIEALRDQIASAVAEVLIPLLPEALSRKALDELREAMDRILASGEERPIFVTGRADLVAALARSHGGHAAFRFEPGGAPEVLIQTGDTRVRSTLTAWAERLAAEMGADR